MSSKLKRLVTENGWLRTGIARAAVATVGSAAGKSLLESPSCETMPPAPATPTLLPRWYTEISLPGHPFGVVVAPDGRWVFVSVQSADSGSVDGVAVLRRDGQGASLVRVIPLRHAPWGLALTRDGSLLLVADGNGVAFVDAIKAPSRSEDAVLGYVNYGSELFTIQVALSKDEHYVFATDEHNGTVSMINLGRARAVGYAPDAVVGQIPVDLAPVGIALSPDGNHLYVTTEMARLGAGHELANWFIYTATYFGNLRRAGMLIVLDVARARCDPAGAVVARVPAGCHPVRVVLSPGGELAWVTARASNTLLAFSTSRLLTGLDHALLASTPVGTMPVGVVLIDGGAVAVVANSNRVAGGRSPQTLSLIDTEKALAGQPATLGTVRVGAFPRELAVGPDGRTLFLTNYNSDTLAVMDVASLLKP
jgi:DNA-binding beta-propeller fold protein YncE